MRLTRSQFLNLPRKAVTLMGMSGVGKSTLSTKLAGRGWARYSCDEEIVSTFLTEALAGGVGDMATFLGKLGNPAKGGLDPTEFRRRQQLYMDGEMKSLKAATQVMQNTARDFVIDSTGSLCEVEDEALLADVGGRTLFVYIQASADEEAEILRRAEEFPKPLYFPPAFLDAHLKRYIEEQDLFGVQDVEPDAFSRWIFPHLFHARLPKYERLARMYGVTVPSAALRDVADEGAFIEAIAGALDEA